MSRNRGLDTKNAVVSKKKWIIKAILTLMVKKRKSKNNWGKSNKDVQGRERKMASKKKKLPRNF